MTCGVKHPKAKKTTKKATKKKKSVGKADSTNPMRRC
jgi:hypothetical protein